MCRSKSGKHPARRCPSHSNRASIAKRNAQRRALYAERKNGSMDTTSPTLSGSSFVSAVKMMSFDEATRLIQTGNYEVYEHNPYVKRLYGEDGSSMLYVPAENVVDAVSDAVYDYDLGYRLLNGKNIDSVRGFCSFSRLKELETALESGDPLNQSYVVKNALYDKFSSINAGIASMMADEDSASALRNRFFNYFDRDEYVIRNADGSVAGYAFSYRGKEPVTLDEMNPSLTVDPKSDGYKDYMWAKNTVEGIFQADSGAYDVQIRDEYFTEVEQLVKKHGFPQRGAYRMVFDAGDTVIKIPLNADGLTHNAAEANHSAGKVDPYHKDVPMASCQLAYTAKGMPFLVMEKVDMVNVHRHDQPAWAKSIDNFQFGRSRVTGEFVAYDL